jgi:hypothetical protein
MDIASTANTNIEAPLYCAEQIKVPETLPVSAHQRYMAFGVI